jgi:hypothetical protein
MGEPDKLDLILKQLDDLKGIPEKLNSVIMKFDSFIKETTVWKRGIEDSLESAHKDIVDLKTKCAEKTRHDEFQQLRTDFYNDNLRTRIKSNKQNLIFCGISGMEKGKWETESVLRDFWISHLGIPEDIVYSITLLDCHRMRSDSHSPNIIAKFAQMTDRDYVLSYAVNLKDYKIKTNKGMKQQFFVDQHYPMELQEQKRALMPLFHKARQAKLPRYFKVVGTELALFINKQRFHPGQQIPGLTSTAMHTYFSDLSHDRTVSTPESSHLMTSSSSSTTLGDLTMSSRGSSSTSTPHSPPGKRSRVGDQTNSSGSPSMLQADGN